MVWWICMPFARRSLCNGDSENWAPNKNPSPQSSLHMSIELLAWWFSCPCWSVDFIIAETCQLVALLLANVRLDISFFDFHFTSFLANSTIFHVIVIIAMIACYCCFHREKVDLSWKWTTEWDSGGQRCATISGLLVLVTFLFGGLDSCFFYSTAFELSSAIMSNTSLNTTL